MKHLFEPVTGQRDGPGERETLFETLAQNLTRKGYSIHTNALPNGLSQKLWDLQQNIPSAEFRKAGVGKNKSFNIDALTRTDKISWIDNASPAGVAWNYWAASLQTFLNTQLYLGLFSFESHFSHYSDGGFYQKHQDAFSGQNNRILSIVTYLNRDWVSTDAGELVLFTGDKGGTPILISPQFGTLVAFLSEEVPHEVLMTNSDRYSIAGWFRINSFNEPANETVLDKTHLKEIRKWH